MAYIIYTVVSLGPKDKKNFMNWLKDDHEIPTHRPNIVYESDGFCLDDNIIHLAIFEETERILLDKYCEENIITDETNDDNLNSDFYGYCSIKYNLIEKQKKIPMLKKECITDINELNKMLSIYKYDKLLLVLLMRKLLEKNKIKTFYQLNFDALNFEELFRAKLYNIHYIFPYYNLTLLSSNDIIELVQYWNRYIRYNIE